MGDQENPQDVEGHQFARVVDSAAFDELQHRYVAMEEFLAISVHEFKSPLTSLWLQVHSLQRRIDADAESVPGEVLAPALERMDRQIRRLNQLVEDLQNVNRPTAGRLDLERETMDLVPLVREIIDRLEPEAVSKGISIVLAEGPPARGSWDRLRLDMAISNLISNAIKYGAGKPVEVSVENMEHRVRLVVRDAGSGIDAKDHVRIFERFERAAGDRAPDGIGLGLYIAMGIVEAHGGRLTVQSALGEGSTFVIELPK